MEDHKTREGYPLLESQIGIYLSCLRHEDMTKYNLPSVLWFSKSVDAVRLSEAIQQIISERKELHSRLYIDAFGDERQFIDMDMPIEVTHRMMSDIDARHYMVHDFVRPFHLFGDSPLCRFEILETESHTLLLSDFHHIISDGMTIAHNFVGHDIPEAYSKGVLASNYVSLRECVAEEQRQLQSSQYQYDKTYFLELFSDATETVLFHRRKKHFGKLLCCKRQFKSSTVDAWCSSQGISANLLFMSAFSIVLSKLSHTKRPVFCTLNHGRYNKRWIPTYGMFVKTSPVIAPDASGLTFHHYAEDLKRQLHGILRHKTYPFTHFCRDTGLSPDITFSFQGSDIQEKVCIDGITYPGEQLSKGLSDQDLSCMVYKHGTDYEMRIEGSESLYSESEINAFGDCMVNVFWSIMSNPESIISDIEILDRERRSRIIQLSTGEATGLDSRKTIIDYIEDHARRTPDKTAVSDGTHTLTYSELTTKSRQLASWLHLEGHASNPFIGIDTYPCIEYMIGVLGIMYAGRAYVPIDARNGKSHNSKKQKDAGISYILNSSTIRSINTEEEGENKSLPDGLAYMIYTSGTTGNPKGVAISHKALLNHTRFIVRRWGLNQSSRIFCHSSFSFDASIEDLFPVLTAGGTLYIMPDDVRKDMGRIYDFICNNHITGGCFTTRLGVILSKHYDLPLEYMCVGGEALYEIPKGKFRKYNTYGPTEFTCNATYYEITDETPSDNIPIGRPVDNCNAYILDPYGHLVSDGFCGELCLSGAQISNGYLHDDLLTHAKFRWCDDVGATVYHTGDMARWNESGQLEYIGRLDRQVKIDGHRIELDGIEHCVSLVPSIDDCSVVVRQDSGLTISIDDLVVYYTSKHIYDEVDLKSQLSHKLPSYMVPRHYIHLNEMPRNHHGKTDIKKLPSVRKKKAINGDGGDSIESLICHVFNDVVGMDTIGETDHFFDSGGSSLNAMEAVALLHKNGLRISYSDLFSHPTARDLAMLVRSQRSCRLYHVDDYDYSNIDRYLKTYGISGRGANKSHEGGILLTGGTGFLGIHLLKELIDKTPHDVYCMVHSNALMHAEQRMHEAIEYYFGGSSGLNDHSRVHLLSSDISDYASLEALSALPFKLVINSAANVKYFSPDDSIERTNIKGVENIVRFCAATNRTLVQISTLSVGGVSSEGRFDSYVIKANELYRGQHFIDTYSYTKFIGERMILERAAKGELDAKIIRLCYLYPSLKAGRSRMDSKLDGMKYIMPMAEASGMTGNIVVEKMPVDTAARMIVEEIENHRLPTNYS